MVLQVSYKVLPGSVSVRLCAQVVSNKEMTRPLLLKNKRPADHGTITVSELKH